jgi:thiamine biosynthesis protein ThiS
MRLTVNGHDKEYGDGITVAGLLDAEGEPARHVLVEVNGEYVLPTQHASRVLSSGDRIEIILPAFGG